MNRFALAYREQQQLFLFDKAYLWGVLLKVGGLATLIARFVVQFFWNPVVALTLTFILLGLSAYMTWAYVRDSAKDWPTLPLCVIPSIIIGASLLDNSLHFDYLTAILIVQAGLLLFKSIKSQRTAWGIIISITLYFTTGSAAILFALCSVFLDSGKNLKEAIANLLAVAVSGAAAFLAAGVPTWSSAFTPVLYYDIDSTLPVTHWAGWVALPAAMLLCRLIKGSRLNRLTAFACGLVLVGLVLIPAGKLEEKMEVEQPRLGYLFEYYTVNEDWDGLVKACEKAPWLPRTANYLNMALAWQGKLAENLLKYDQRGADGLVMTTKDRAVDIAQAHIMFTMGNVAAAQDVAFNTLISLQGYCPPMVKINAFVELMRGSYEVADKYISLLEKAPHYRKWARDMRRFLQNDSAVEADPLLGNGRRNLGAENHFIMYTNPMTELFPILDANPTDKRALEYGLCYLLLAKDLNSVKHFILDYYSSPDSPELPRIAQEAMVFYSEYSRNMEGVKPFGFDWCLEHGVRQETIKRFEEYQRAAVAGGTALRRFKGTYWYYLVHTQI